MNLVNTVAAVFFFGSLSVGVPLIDGGRAFPQRTPAQHFGIYQLGDCSSVAVSSNTLLTAAHCPAVGAGRGCITGTRLCTTSVHAAPAFESGVPRGPRDDGADVAVLIFPEGSFPVYSELYQAGSAPLAAGRGVMMVGFADDHPTRQSFPGGRWGRNVILEIETHRGSRIKTRYGNTFDSAKTFAGDSGGPLFVDCRVAGIAQSNGIDFLGDFLFSMHSDLSRADTQAFFRSLRSRGAEFCGIEGANARLCPQVGLLRVRTLEPGDENFACDSQRSME